MFTLIGIVVGFACLAFLIWLVDRIAVNRGLGGAHPLSPAIAYALLAGTVLIGVFVLIGMHFDYEAIRALSNTQTGEKL